MMYRRYTYRPVLPFHQRSFKLSEVMTDEYALSPSLESQLGSQTFPTSRHLTFGYTQEVLTPIQSDGHSGRAGIVISRFQAGR